jgi:CRISPR/Cas system-associated exonuclease Cas4 (RecB family)
MASENTSPAQTHDHHDQDPQQESATRLPNLIHEVSADSFANWYEEREVAENIRNGQPYFNGPPSQHPPERHNPSKLLQCHRKSYYKHFNAPKETEAPQGVFWIGEQFETEIAVPFLRSLTDESQYVRNSMWIDYETTAAGEPIRIRGETDPVIVDRESTPQLLSEIKTTSSVEHLDGPKHHHKAQVHAYLHGLSAKHDVSLTDAVILYAARESLDIQTYHIEFDPVFWEQITDWAGTQTAHRVNRDLPPANPEFDWECQYCPYQARCGEGTHRVKDSQPKGILPLFKYPQSQIQDYLEGHEGAKLSPTVAAQHPSLATEYPVRDWVCECCGAEVPFDAVDWDGDTESLPQCPLCQSEERPAELRGTELTEQWPPKAAAHSEDSI